MKLHTKPFPGPVYEYIFFLSWLLFKPFWTSLNCLLSLVLATTAERKSPNHLFIKRFCLLLPYLLLTIILSPFALIGYILRCVVYTRRNPYTLSIQKTSSNQQTKHQLGEIGIGTLNLCLLPEYLSRSNNLANASYRTKEIGKKIIIDQMYYGERDTNKGLKMKSNSLNAGVTCHFPNMDFVCLQEVWQSDYSMLLKNELHKIYPYIICDVGMYSRHSNFYCLNSGLMFASKYEIIGADFQHFNSSCKQCVYSSKGLLMVKVLLWYENVREDKAVVGYIYITHLQAYQGKLNINCKQLDEIVKWTKEFREKSKKDNDIVAFDIICGDFNFDNISPGDKEAREHEIFNLYKDDGRVKTGVDQDWTIGTEMRQLNMYNEEVLTPEGLKLCLDTPIKRQEYLTDGDIIEANLDTIVYTPHKTTLSNVGGKRRIDYIIHNKQCPVVPYQFNFITRLTTLTDHIPVVMQFYIPNRKPT
ncbi:hypothetical protein LOTGIDRAFT_229790 [Lottia gigantea]|uniref:sphingomyelin phosphodiesterase n=1 Tax=Lottia gigantea TaxID=225164 RepID=V3ZK49_LOTGI|nr:hypothetical protein LOTGIDRAFT_229790 [Lottia gigantea]ESO82765.1 hypothetical protein LOTGIDRAFT_229790 [Lottia gigantea]